jgi:uncharacterized protein DUF3182
VVGMAKGCVVTHCRRGSAYLRTHEGIALSELARGLARLKAYEFAGDHSPTRAYDGALFFVPDDTLLAAQAGALGIVDATDLFGGIVPHEFVKTKAISHGLVGATSPRPDGWSETFAARVRHVVLPGYTVFSGKDARTAAARLLPRAAVRVKSPTAAGMRGQWVATTTRDVDAILDGVSADDIARDGLVLEVNLDTVETLSVGHITVDDLIVSYHGTQRLTRDNEGRRVYGGSDLVCVRGGWDELEHLQPAPAVRRAIAQARVYDGAALRGHGVRASRRNYDVGVGRDARGSAYSGVFEQSWRAGGASGAEVAALEAFASDPTLDRVHASAIEVYGDGHEAPPHSTVQFHGVDVTFGPMLRYTLVDARARLVA